MNKYQTMEKNSKIYTVVYQLRPLKTVLKIYCAHIFQMNLKVSIDSRKTFTKKILTGNIRFQMTFMRTKYVF